jgi:hypothetical protein
VFIINQFKLRKGLAFIVLVPQFRLRNQPPFISQPISKLELRKGPAI